MALEDHNSHYGNQGTRRIHGDERLNRIAVPDILKKSAHLV